MEKLQGKQWTSWLKNWWIFIPALLYFRIVNHYAVNIPWSDDYDAVLGFLLEFRAAAYHDKIVLLFSQHNEHRIFSSRLIYVLYDTLFGSINFRVLTFIGNVQLLVIFSISIHFIRNCIPEYWSIPAFIWGLCLFDLNSYENGGVTMTGVANYGIVMLFFISLFLYSLGKRNYLIPAVIVQIICMFSNGNGVIASFFIVVYALFTRDRVKIKFSIAALLIFAPLYFLHYVSPPHDTVPHSIKHEIGFFFSLLGAHFSAEQAL
jgi:hypothetical protein